MIYATTWPLFDDFVFDLYVRPLAIRARRTRQPIHMASTEVCRTWATHLNCWLRLLWIKCDTTTSSASLHLRQAVCIGSFPRERASATRFMITFRLRQGPDIPSCSPAELAPERHVVGDSEAPLLRDPSGSGASPANFHGESLSDQLHRQYSQSRFYTISLKDRTAILMEHSGFLHLRYSFDLAPYSCLRIGHQLDV